MRTAARYDRRGSFFVNNLFCSTGSRRMFLNLIANAGKRKVVHRMNTRSAARIFLPRWTETDLSAEWNTRCPRLSELPDRALYKSAWDTQINISFAEEQFHMSDYIIQRKTGNLYAWGSIGQGKADKADFRTYVLQVPKK